MAKGRDIRLLSLTQWFIVLIFATFLIAFYMLYSNVLWQTQNRYNYKLCLQSYLPRVTNFGKSRKELLSSMLQLNRYLENKVLFIDPRFIPTMQDVQVNFIDNKQKNIGEESLDDILESNTVMMAFFDHDKLDILYLLKKYNLSWKKDFDQNFAVTIDGISHQLMSLSLSKTEDYFEFAFRKIKRIIPKFAIMNYKIRNETFIGPANWITFEWTLRRSKFISCSKDFAVLYRKIYPQFFNQMPQIRNEVILTLQKFRNWAVKHNVTPMLYAGTLLGWYRECGIIPYTHDIDFAIFIEEHYDKFHEDIMNSSFMKLSLRFNKPKDLLEYKVYLENNIPMDIFFLYHDENNSWTGGLAYTTKYRFIYPLINRTCATDFLGYLMYIPCNALDVIMSEHGKNWSEPLHSSEYIWNKSPLNMREAGTISPEEEAESFIQYDSMKKEKTNRNNYIFLQKM